MKFNISNPTTTNERLLLKMINISQNTQSAADKKRTIDFAKKNWASIGDDFQKACYWVFGRATFVKSARYKATDETISIEGKIFASYEENGAFDV